MRNARRNALWLWRSTSTRKASPSPWRARARTVAASVASIRYLDGWGGGMVRSRGLGRLGAFRDSSFDLWQRGDDDVSDDLQAPGADRVERVAFGVPRVELQVDDVHRRHASL